ncbi:MAG TPA: hypothetical protein VMM79_21100 [Longimicrobiales bacterium]|jgi:hypothetical protein|nr:hypothetical protein [Longimicrobiales bacterium]
MSRSARSSTPWIFWPVAAVWDLIAFVLRLTGRLIGFTVGLILVAVGGVLTLTVILLPIGLPLLVVGFLLMVRSVFTIF